MFSKQTYINRREVLGKNMQQKGIILLLSNIENPVNFRDNTYRFRQDSTFLYYFGIQMPHLAGVIDLDEQKSLLFGDEMTMDQIVWMGRQKTLKQKSDEVGVTTTLGFSELRQYLQNAQNQGREIHIIPPYQSFNKILLSELLNCSIDRLRASVELIQNIVKQREIKEQQEIVEIESALQVSTQMHLLAMRLCKAGAKEYEITSAIEHYAQSHNCFLAYPSIVTIHGEILHNHYNQNVLQKGQLLLNDSGAETQMGYASDLTRTTPVDATFTPLQRDLYNVVLDSFNVAKAKLGKGVEFKSVHLEACLVLSQGLIDLGFFKGNAQDIVDQHIHTLFFQCGLGHMMGLDVHDMEDLGEQYVGYTPTMLKETKQFGLKSLRLGKALQPGHVVTVEPGLYFIGELMDRWASEGLHKEFINYDKVLAHRDFGGIRIEDNFLIQDNGARLLGPELIKTVEEIEAYKAQFL